MTTVARQEHLSFQANLYADPNPTRRGLHGTRRAWVEAALREFVKPGTKVLEVGVGCGVFTRHLSESGADVTAVDINPDFIRGVATLPNVTGMCATPPSRSASDRRTWRSVPK